MNQEERITYYENILNNGEEIVKRLEENITLSLVQEFKEFQSKIDELDVYYQSDVIRQDILDYEEGNIRKDLPCGVLGEDYVYDLLTSWDELKERLKNY